MIYGLARGKGVSIPVEGAGAVIMPGDPVVAVAVHARAYAAVLVGDVAVIQTGGGENRTHGNAERRHLARSGANGGNVVIKAAGCDVNPGRQPEEFPLGAG